MFAVGTFITIIPFLEHSGIFTLSTPTPARTIAFIFVACSIKKSSTSVELLVIATSAVGIIFSTNSFLSTSAAITKLMFSSFSSISKPA